MLKSSTHPRWFIVSTADIGGLLSDHLHCERKAAENALSLVRRYPHNHEFVETLSRLAHEETSHVIQVTLLLADLGLTPRTDMANTYTRALLRHARSTEPERRVDLLLCGGLIEARSHERLTLLARGFSEAKPQPRLAAFYDMLANAEERHAGIFVSLAKMFLPAAAVEERLGELAALEAEVLAAQPFESRVH